MWLTGFWLRQRFRNLAQVQREAPRFWHWYHCHYRLPGLAGQTPAHMRRGVMLFRLSAKRRDLIPDGRLPITAGRVHILRRVNEAGHVQLLNEQWTLDDQWRGEYVRATINGQARRITFWHQHDASSDWRLLATRPFPIEEPVYDL